MKSDHPFKSAWIGALLLFGIAFAPLQKVESSAIFRDDFEKYTSDSDVRRAYTVWEDGADMRVSLQRIPVHSGRQALAIYIASPNAHNQSDNGSIYHILSYFERNWSTGSGIRFWVDNANSKPLLLSINFKEEYNEYWAVAGEGIFFLQDENGALTQKKIEYGNLPIPPQYQGLVVVPFFSFAVPEWNTARGNEQLDLAKIESYAVAVTLDGIYPRTFSIDDIEVLAPTEFKTLTIQGAASIAVPASGEHREQYTTHLGSPVEQTSLPVHTAWALRPPYDPAITLDNNGGLTIPSGVQDESVTLTATYSQLENPITSEFVVELIGSQPQNQPTAAGDAAVTPQIKTETAYDRFSRNFETWATQNRPLFVLITVSVIAIFLAVLSYFQRRLK
jgi:hypothetical protein